MKKSFLNLKSRVLFYLFVLTFSNSLFAQFPNPPALICQDSYSSTPETVRFSVQNQSPSNPTNAMSILITTESVYVENISQSGQAATGYWITTKVYTVTIPFYDYFLTGNLKISTDTFCNYPASYPNTNNVNNWWVNGTIKVNGSLSPNGVTNYYTGDLPVGSHNYVVESICTGGVGVYNTYSQTCNTQNFRVVVNRMPNPLFNFTTTAFCRKNNLNLFTGFIGFNLQGTYSNVDNRFLLDFSNASNSLSNFSIPLTSIGSTSGASGANTFNNNAGGLYSVKMKFVFTNTAGTVVSYVIPNGEYGWNNYSYNKTWKSCMNYVKGDLIKFTEKSALPITDPNNDPESRRKPRKFSFYPNPISNVLSIKTSDSNKIKSVKILTNNNLLIQEEKINSDTNFQEIDVSKLKSGLYFLEVETTEGTSIEKIMKN